VQVRKLASGLCSGDAASVFVGRVSSQPVAAHTITQEVRTQNITQALHTNEARTRVVFYGHPHSAQCSLESETFALQ
jgi:hypothetical protein